MKLIVAGSREIVLTTEIFEEHFLPYKSKITELVSGCAIGPDTFALEYAKEHNIPYEEFPVKSHEWTLYGKAAGMMRNFRMGDYADALLAFWDQKSPGTKGMINYMKKLKKPYHVVLILDNQLDI